jgi:hypothetical protein
VLKFYGEALKVCHCDRKRSGCTVDSLNERMLVVMEVKWERMLKQPITRQLSRASYIWFITSNGSLAFPHHWLGTEFDEYTPQKGIS